MRRHGLRFYNNVSHRKTEPPRMKIKMMMMTETRARGAAWLPQGFQE